MSHLFFERKSRIETALAFTKVTVGTLKKGAVGTKM